jgi:hypothetical protein
MARPNDRVFFALTAVAGASILVGCVLPTFELYLFATVGGGDDQQSYDFYRELRFATYPEPGALVFPLAGLAFLAIGILGLLKQGTLLIAVVAAVTVPAFVQTIRTIDINQTAEGGVLSCEKPRLEDCVHYLAPAVRDLRADILRRPIARHPDFLGPSPEYFSIRRLGGWQLIAWTIGAFSLFAWFRAALLLPLSSAQAALVYAGVLVTVFLIVILWLFRNFEP